MHDINRAERLLSLFTSPDSAAGIMGDLSEERGQRGGAWFWRQVLGTVFSLGRGALFESPMVVLGLVILGFALSAAVALGTSAWLAYLFNLHQPTDGLKIFLISALFTWPGKLITGATLVAVAPRSGMAACALVAGLKVMLTLAWGVFVFFVLTNPSPFLFWGLSWSVNLLTTPALLLLGGAMIRHRRIQRQLRTA